MNTILSAYFTAIIYNPPATRTLAKKCRKHPTYLTEPLSIYCHGQYIDHVHVQRIYYGGHIKGFPVQLSDFI